MDDNKKQERLFEIWSEGYAATGDSSGAFLHGLGKGKDFKEACVQFAEENPEFKKYFDEDRMAYWGCALFDNEWDASRSFG